MSRLDRKAVRCLGWLVDSGFSVSIMRSVSDRFGQLEGMLSRWGMSCELTLRRGSWGVSRRGRRELGIVRSDIGTQFLKLLAGGPDEDVCVGRPFYCGKGYEYDFGVGYLCNCKWMVLIETRIGTYLRTRYEFL